MIRIRIAIMTLRRRMGRSRAYLATVFPSESTVAVGPGRGGKPISVMREAPSSRTTESQLVDLRPKESHEEILCRMCCARRRREEKETERRPRTFRSAREGGCLQ